MVHCWAKNLVHRWTLEGAAQNVLETTTRGVMSLQLPSSCILPWKRADAHAATLNSKRCLQALGAWSLLGEVYGEVKPQHDLRESLPTMSQEPSKVWLLPHTASHSGRQRRWPNPGVCWCQERIDAETRTSKKCHVLFARHWWACRRWQFLLVDGKLRLWLLWPDIVLN